MRLHTVGHVFTQFICHNDTDDIIMNKCIILDELIAREWDNFSRLVEIMDIHHARDE